MISVLGKCTEEASMQFEPCYEKAQHCLLSRARGTLSELGMGWDMEFQLAASYHFMWSFHFHVYILELVHVC